MNLHGIAKGKSFEKTIEMLKNAEINGANQYFTMYFLAKELGYDAIADATIKMLQKMQHMAEFIAIY